MNYKPWMMMLLFLSTFAVAGDSCGWGYDQCGLGRWGDTCANGWRQSPIDIRSELTHPGTPKKLIFDYSLTTYSTKDKGYNIDFDPKDSNGGTLTIGTEVYQLIQFHFHVTSEHSLNGLLFPMEAHLVHKNKKTGELAVIGVFFEIGAKNNLIEALWKLFPDGQQHQAPDELELNAKDLLPKSLVQYRYSGSLTTPSCDEIVSWIVMQQPTIVTQAQIHKFTQIIGKNARPEQPLNRREITLVRP